MAEQARAHFPRRDVDLDFDLAAVPRDWYRQDRFLTLYWSGLSLLFPQGERFFVEAVRHFRGEVRDPALAADVVGFTGQEAVHGREHQAFNDLVRSQGLPVDALDRQLRWILATARKVLSPASRLAATCALEHFTAIMAEQLLAQPAHQEAIDPAVRPLWLWHALEESEHRAVAFDVYRAIGAGYPRRVWIMILTTVVFALEVVNVHLRLLAADHSLWSPRRWLRGLGYLWLRPGLLRTLIKPYLAYYKPSFHPAERNVDALIAATRARLFGPGGPLEGKVREVWSKQVEVAA